MRAIKRGLFVNVVLGIFLFIALVSAIPQILINSPSSSPFYTTNTSVELNFSIIESNLGSLIYNWNGTNFTMYNGSLVLMMNFDNLSALGENSTFFIDSSTRGSNATCFSTSCPIWNSSGKYGGAYQFDGIDDFMQTPTIPTTNLHNWTLSAWVKPGAIPSDTNTAEFIVVNGYGDTSGYSMGIMNGSNNFTVLYNGVAWYNSNYIVANNTWTHLLVTNNNTNLYFYANGNLVSTSLATGNPSAPANNATIGKQVSAVKRNFNGTIDEVRIWNRSLSASEVYQQYVSNLQKYNSTQWYLYVNQSKNATAGLDYGAYIYQTFATNSSGSLNSTVQQTIKVQSDIIFPQLNFTSPTPQNSTTTTNTSIIINTSISEANLNSLIYNWNGTNFTMYNDSLILMYNFENLSTLGENKTRVVDVSRNGYNGTVNRNASWNSSGKYGGAYQFDGYDSYINASDIDNSITNGFSFFTWFKANQTSTAARICEGSYSNNQGISVFVFANVLYWRIGTGTSNIDLTIPFNDTSSWHHSGFVWNGTTVNSYLDGVLRNTSAAASYGNSNQFIIGGRSNGLVNDQNWNGMIDEMSLWNRSFSVAEVYQQYVSNLQKFNQTQWYLYVNQSKNATSGLDYGTYTYQIFATDISGNLNSTEQRAIIIGQTEDTTYPTFSNYSDNNGTLNNSGIAWFNVTVLNTNGTVWLRINNTNYTATNLTANVYNVSVNLTSAGTYNYTWYAHGNGSSHNYNVSATTSYVVNYLDTIYPQFSNYSDNNGTLNNSGIAWFNVTLTNTNGTVVLEINNTNITATNLTLNVYNASYVFTSNGTYSYRWHSWGNGPSHNYNISETRSYIVNYLDTTYPTFSNYSDNNASLSGSGTALFNVTVLNTNGTVWLRINNTNYTATNLTANVYNVSVNLTSAGTYNYTWYAHGNGSSHNYNVSATTSYVVNYLDTIYPQFSNYSDNNGTLNNSGIAWFNVTLTNTNGTVVLEINNTNITATNLTLNVYNASYVFTSNGTYSYRWHSWGNGPSHNYNISETRSYIVNYLDTTYPTFSNYSDNNASLSGSGTALFNVTVLNTNGTVWLRINNTNYTATNLTANVYNVSVNLTSAGTYNYTWYAHGNGSSHNYNVSATTSYVVNYLDTIYPQFSNYSDNNGTLNNSGIAWFNVTLTNTNGTVVLEINNTNITATNLTLNVYNASYVFTSNGTYSYRWHSWGNGPSHNYNISETRSYIVNYLDTTYPTFSNYSDNNASLSGSGTALFNVTVLNTNGTVWLRINNTNYTATNLTANVYNVSVNLTSAGTYNYTWYAHGNGSTNLLNNSETRYYVVNVTVTATLTETPVETSTYSGGGGIYLLEQSTKTNNLEISTFISPNKSITTKIKQDKGTGIKEIELKAKNWLSGRIYIVAYNETPDFCSINYQGEHKVYKVLDFNNTLKEDSVDSGRLKIGIQKDWIYSNNISEIKFVRCYPKYEEIKSSYDSETNEEGIYDVYINGFSAYAILGTLESRNSSENGRVWNNNPSYNLGKIFLWAIIIIFLVLVIILIIKHRIKLIEHFHSKWIDLDIKFRIGR